MLIFEFLLAKFNSIPILYIDSTHQRSPEPLEEEEIQPLESPFKDDTLKPSVSTSYFTNQGTLHEGKRDEIENHSEQGM